MTSSSESRTMLLDFSYTAVVLGVFALILLVFLLDVRERRQEEGPQKEGRAVRPQATGRFAGDGNLPRPSRLR